MNTAELDIELLTPLSLPARSRSLDDAGTRHTIPGASLLGSAARAIHDELSADDAFRIFQTSDVVFGDGLPILADQALLPTPASLHVPKGATGSPLSNLLDDDERRRIIHARIQVDRFKAPFVGSTLDVSATINTSLSLRTSVTLEGRAAEGLLFTLQTLPAGLRFRTTLRATRLDDLERIVAALEGDQRLGRSRGSELGRVRLTRRPSPAIALALPEPQLRRISLLCVSSAAFRDPKTGMPTFRPTAPACGLPDSWRLDLERSFIRTESYTPFHGKRALFDMDRHLIERGSIITFVADAAGTPFDGTELRRALLCGVGEYKNQGLGQLLVMDGRLLAPTIKAPKAFDLPINVAASATKPDDELFRWATEIATQRSEASEAFDWAYEKAKNTGKWRISMAQWGELRRRAREARIGGVAADQFRAELEHHLTTGIAGLERAWGGTEGRLQETRGSQLLALLSAESHPAARLELLAELTARHVKTKEDRDAAR